MKSYYQPTYRRNIFVIEYKDINDVHKEINQGIKENKIEMDKDDKIIDTLYQEDISGYSMVLHKTDRIIYLIGINTKICKTNKEKNLTLIHELIHTIYKRYKGIGVDSVDCDGISKNEPEAYLISELYKEFQF